MGTLHIVTVHIISRKVLRDFWTRHNDAEQPLKAWFQEAKHAKWKDPNKIKPQYVHASILKNSRVVFNIAGNKYRLVVRVNYDYKMVYVKFIGTHKEYDSINAETI